MSHSPLLTRSRTGVDLNCRLAAMALSGSGGNHNPAFDGVHRVEKQAGIVLLQRGGIGKQAPPQPRARMAMVGAEHVPRHMPQRADGLRILQHPVHDFGPGFAGIGEHPRVVIRGSAEHHAIHMIRMKFDFFVRADAAVDHDSELRKVLLQPIDVLVLERRNLAVLFRREALEDGIARVDDEGPAAGRGDRGDKVPEKGVILDPVDAGSMLHRDRNADFAPDSRDALRDQRRLGHQAGAESALLHPLARAADVEVDLVVAVIRAELRAAGEILRVAAAELQADRVLRAIESEMLLDVAVEQRAAGDHLGVEPGTRADLPEKVPAMAVGEIHHRGDENHRYCPEAAARTRIRPNRLSVNGACTPAFCAISRVPASRPSISRGLPASMSCSIEVLNLPRWRAMSMRASGSMSASTPTARPMASTSRMICTM